ncbi:hypothetical protein C0991_002586, partial [Blastosporella zonata]
MAKLGDDNAALIEHVMALSASMEARDDQVVKITIEQDLDNVAISPTSLHSPDKEIDGPGRGDNTCLAFMAAKEVDTLPTAVTYADSGASNHCFVNKSEFSNYEQFDRPRYGQPAN